MDGVPWRVLVIDSDNRTLSNVLYPSRAKAAQATETVRPRMGVTKDRDSCLYTVKISSSR